MTAKAKVERLERIERRRRPITVVFAPPGVTAAEHKATLPDPERTVVIEAADAKL